MTGLRQALVRLLSFFRKQELDGDFDEELTSHIELATDEHIRHGLSPAEARRQALIKLGGIEPSKEAHRETRGLPWLDGVLQDIRYAVRSLRRSPGFTFTAVATLACGIGVNAAVFTVANGEVFKAFPSVVENDRILYVSSLSQCCVSYPDFEDWREQAKSFDGMGAVADLRITLGDETGFPETYTVSQVSANTFELIGQRPMLGRDFTRSDEMRGAAPVVILSYGLWERRYGQDPAIVGRTLSINGISHDVIGVMPQGVAFPQNQDLWAPLTPTQEPERREARRMWFAFGRLADGATTESARAEMETIGDRLAVEFPLTNEDFRPVVQSFQEFFIGPDAELAYRAMLGAVGFLLLIACANLANLMLAHTASRSRDLSVRVALGAGRRRIIRQLLTESMLLSLAGGVCGWWIASAGVRAYQATAPQPHWRVVDYAMDYRVFAYLAVISVGAGLLFSLAPISRLSKLDVHSTLKNDSRGAVGARRGNHFSSLLAAGQMALAVVLLVGAGVMIRSIWNVYSADLGVRTDHVLTALLNLPVARYPDAASQATFHGKLRERVEAVPGVESVTITERLPASGSRTRPYELADAEPFSGVRRPELSVIAIGPGYFETFHAAMQSGRAFHAFDGASGIRPVIVNQRFADTHWPGEDPLGKRLRMFDAETPGAWRTVVGVAPNIIQNDFTRQEFNPMIYVPYGEEEWPRETWVVLRTSIPPAGFANAFRREVQTLDADLPIWLGPFALKQRSVGNDGSRRVNGILFLAFAVIALLLASGGLYAVIAHSVSQRTREIGIRMAIGGTAVDIRRLVVRQGMLPLGGGLVLGVAASSVVNRVLESQLVGVSSTDPVTLACASAVLILAATLGCLIPARRAARVDPLTALRHD